MNFPSGFRSLFLATSLIAVGACGQIAAVDDIRGKTDAEIARSDAAFAAFGRSPSLRPGGAQINNGVFVAPIKERNNSSALLPANLQTPNAISFSSRDPLTIGDMVTRLTSITGIEHVASLGSPNRSVQSDTGSRVVRPNYSGKLSEVLAKVSADYGVEWSFADGKIIFRDYVTRQYQIPVIPSVASGGSSVGSSSSGYTADFWSEFEASVDGMLDDDVVYNIGKSTGLLTVTAKVDSHADVAAFVAEIAQNVTQQIAFDVNVLSVSMGAENGASLDLNLALADIMNGRNLNMGGSGNIAQQTGGMNLAIVKENVSFEAVIQALSRQGQVTIDTRTGVTTINNRPVPVQVVDTVSYIASINSERDADTGDVRLIPQPATQSVGFELQIYPRILNAREIMVEYSLNLSELLSLDTFGSGDSQVQLPQVSNTKFSQQTILENGHTLILSGFERTRQTVNRNDSGFGGGVMGFGGAQSSTTERVATVVMISPRLLRSSRDITDGRQ